MSFCWECGEAVPRPAVSGDPRRGETGTLLVHLPERLKRGGIELYRNWGEADEKMVASAEAVWTSGEAGLGIGSRYVAVVPYVWHGDYTIVEVEVPSRDQPPNTTRVTIVDGELTKMDWR
jgi:hypothetical protein